eukprot:2334773-Prymnesium_polylepis.1
MQPHARHHVKNARAVLGINGGTLAVGENLNVEARLEVDLSPFETESGARRQVERQRIERMGPLGPGLRGGSGGKLGGEGGGGGAWSGRTEQPGTCAPVAAHEARQSEPSRVSSAAALYVNRNGHPAAMTSWLKEARFFWHAPRNPPCTSLAMSSESTMTVHSYWVAHNFREPNTFGASTQSGWGVGPDVVLEAERLEAGRLEADDRCAGACSASCRK